MEIERERKERLDRRRERMSNLGESKPKGEGKEEEEEMEEDESMAAAEEFLSTTAKIVASKYQQFGPKVTFDDVAGLGRNSFFLSIIITNSFDRVI